MTRGRVGSLTTLLAAHSAVKCSGYGAKDGDKDVAESWFKNNNVYLTIVDGLDWSEQQDPWSAMFCE